MLEPVVRVRDLSVCFGSREVVSGVSFDLAPGKRMVLAGGASSGKSVIAAALAGLVPAPGAVTGSISVRGREMVGASERRWCKVRVRTIALVTQDVRRTLIPTLSIADQIAQTMVRTKSWHKARAEAMQLLDHVGLPAARFADRTPPSLSGGQRQLVGLAQALARDPMVLVADCPTAGLDVMAQARVLRLLDDYARDHALLYCTEDARLVSHLSDEVLELDRELTGLYCGAPA